jgi:hypothetical protein
MFKLDSFIIPRSRLSGSVWYGWNSAFDVRNLRHLRWR